MAVSKKNRQIIFDKYNGHCAYCGDFWGEKKKVIDKKLVLTH